MDIINEYNDPHRPIYHFLPPRYWMNDPNGLIYWKGYYHLFYQHNPVEAYWGRMHWGHAASINLAHWEHRPIALSPTPGQADGDHIYSGCAVNDHGVPTLIYTGVVGDSQLPCLATTKDDGLNTWEKYPGNPIISAPPVGNITGFRDHTVWIEADGWHMGIGCGIRGEGGFIAHYKSRNLRQWEYIGPLCSGKISETGEMWECPDFFRLEDQHILVISPVPLGKAIYTVGSYNNRQFQPTEWHTLDNGGALYAPQSMWDREGRRLLWGWLWETRPEAQFRAAGWAGVMSLPRVLHLGRNGRLHQTPAPELHALRKKKLIQELSQLKGDCVEIVAKFDQGNNTPGLVIRLSPDQTEYTIITYDRLTRVLRIDRSHSSLDNDVMCDIRTAPVDLMPDEAIKLHVFLDRSVVEVFANEREVMATRIYPTRPDSLGFNIVGGNLTSFEAWELGTMSA